MKIVLGVVFLLLAAATSYAAPNVSAISGQISDGQQIVIQGSAFGQNSLNIEWLGGKNGTIESGTVGQVFSRTNWENNWGWANLVYANDQKESGLQSLKVSPDSAVNWNGIMSYNLTAPVNAGGALFISYWVRKVTSGSGQWKMLRVSGNDTIVDGSQEVVLFNWLGTGSPQLVVDPGQSNDQTTWVNDVYPTADNTWYRMDLYLQASSLNTSNGSITINRITPGSAIAAQTISGLKTHLTGYSWNHVIWQNYVGNGMTNGTFWFDDVYIQNGSQARVELGDSSTWSACTIRQIQFPTSWVDGSITVQLNQGSFSSGANAYLYVVDSNGNVNSNGYPVKLGASVSGSSGTTDTIAPTISIASPTAGASVSGNIVITATASDNVGVTSVNFYVDSTSSTAVATVTASPYTFTWNTMTVANGSHTIYAKASDAAGNSKISAGITVTVNNAVVDSTAPTVSIISPAPNATITGITTVTATASDNVGVTRVDFYMNGALQTTVTSSPYLYSWNTSSLAAGTYTLMARAYNAAGNVGQSTSVPVNVRKVSTAPTVKMTFPANNAIVSGSITITAKAKDTVGVSKVEFYEDGTLLSASNVAPYSYGWNTTSVTNTTHTLYAKAYDAAGNVGQSSNISVKVNNPVPDTIKPTVSVTFPANNAIMSGSVTITANASDNVGISKVEFYVNGVLQATDSASPYTFNWNTKSIANGSYTLTVKAYDAAGNIGNSSSVLVSVNNDKTAPTIFIVSPINKATVTGTQTIIVSASDNVGVSKVEFYVNGILQATDSLSPYTFSWNTRSIAKGKYTLAAKAYDIAGNIGQSSSISVTVK